MTKCIPYEIGHCIILGANRYYIMDLKDELALVTHISDPTGLKGKWVLKSLLPIPIAKLTRFNKRIIQ